MCCSARAFDIPPKADHRAVKPGMSGWYVNSKGMPASQYGHHEGWNQLSPPSLAKAIQNPCMEFMYAVS